MVSIFSCRVEFLRHTTKGTLRVVSRTCDVDRCMTSCQAKCASNGLWKLTELLQTDVFSVCIYWLRWGLTRS